MSHTKGKWEVRDEKQDWNDGAVFDIDCEDKHIGFVTRSTFGISDEEALANAKRIVHCVNNYDGLVKALKLIASYNGGYPKKSDNPYIQTYNEICGIAEQAIAKAEEKAERDFKNWKDCENLTNPNL